MVALVVAVRYPEQPLMPGDAQRGAQLRIAELEAHLQLRGVQGDDAALDTVGDEA